MLVGFILFDGNIETLEEIAADFDITRERVRQIQKKALTKIKRDIYLKRFDPTKLDKEYNYSLKRKKGSKNVTIQSR